MHKRLTVNWIHHATSCKIQTLKLVLKKHRNQVGIWLYFYMVLFFENSFPQGSKNSNNVRCLTKDGLLDAPVGWRSGVKPLYTGAVWKNNNCSQRKQRKYRTNKTKNHPLWNATSNPFDNCLFPASDSMTGRLFVFVKTTTTTDKKQKKQGIGNIYGDLDSKRVMENQYGKIHQNDR